jgi:hypothetical protein
MTGIEALKALASGKRIRRQDWGAHEAVCPYETGEYIPLIAQPTYALTMNRWKRINEPLDFDVELQRIYTDFLMDDWELVESKDHIVDSNEKVPQ